MTVLAAVVQHQLVTKIGDLKNLRNRHLYVARDSWREFLVESMPSVAEVCTTRARAEETTLQPETPRSSGERCQRDRGRGLPYKQEYLGLAKPHTHLKHANNCTPAMRIYWEVFIYNPNI